jgi:hypothetical protein
MPRASRIRSTCRPSRARRSRTRIARGCASRRSGWRSRRTTARGFCSRCSATSKRPRRSGPRRARRPEQQSDATLLFITGRVMGQAKHFMQEVASGVKRSACILRQADMTWSSRPHQARSRAETAAPPLGPSIHSLVEAVGLGQIFGHVTRRVIAAGHNDAEIARAWPHAPFFPDDGAANNLGSTDAFPTGTTPGRHGTRGRDVRGRRGRCWTCFRARTALSASPRALMSSTCFAVGSILGGRAYRATGTRICWRHPRCAARALAR